MRFEKLFILLGTLFFSLPSLADTRWSGGGGELIKDSRNPWWVQNTQKVYYCIQVDPDGNFEYSAELGSLSSVVRRSLDYWKGQFAKAQENPGIAKVFVATQEFIETGCDNNHDLTFQFGILSDKQQRRLKKLGANPLDHVSMAVRTHYDTVNLHAKGFIYVAPNDGILRPDSEDMVKKPWNEGTGGRLVHVLTHEDSVLLHLPGGID